VPLPSTPDSWIESEAAFTAAVHRAGAPVPAPLGIEEVDGRRVSIYERLVGVSMWSHIVQRPAAIDQMIRQLVDLQVALMAVVAPVELPRQRDRTTCKIRIAAAHHGASLADAIRAVPAETQHRLCHGDVRRGAEQCAEHGVEVWTARFDVTDHDEVGASVSACVDELGIPTRLFNNAGQQGAFARVDRYAPDDARRVLEVKVLGMLNVLTTVTAAMVEAGVGGAIVCSASMAGVTGAANMPACSASKAAVIGLVKSAAKDLAPVGIRVNAISPAFIGPGRMWDRQVAAQAAAPSPYFADDPDEVARQMIDTVPMRRYGTIEEVAAVVGFLLSDDASYVTGVNVEIAGGSP